MTPPSFDMGSVGRVLIIKMSAFGDIVHALPVAAALKASFPHIEITWAVEEAFAPLVTGNPSIDNILTLPKIGPKELRSPKSHRYVYGRLWDVRRRKFDVTLDLQGLLKSAVVAGASGARVRLAYHWMREAASLFERAVPQEPGSIHIVDQYLDVARFVGAKTGAPQFPFYISDEDEAATEAMLQDQGIEPGERFVSINPASGLAIKQWDAKRYAALLRQLYERSGLKGAVVTADKAVASQVAEHAVTPFANLAGRTSLKQLGAVLRRSAVHICGDTGSGHLGAALCTPVIALIGPTDADRSCPYGQRQNAIQHRDRCGSACNWHHCEFATPRCIEAIAPDEVFAKVETVLAAARS